MDGRVRRLVVRDALWLRYDGPIPRPAARSPDRAWRQPFCAWTAARTRAGIARRRRQLSGVAAVVDTRLRVGVAHLSDLRGAAVGGSPSGERPGG
jgi:hypothetical protein